jgi:hypothetical protein
MVVVMAAPRVVLHHLSRPLPPAPLACRCRRTRPRRQPLLFARLWASMAYSVMQVALPPLPPPGCHREQAAMNDQGSRTTVLLKPARPQHHTTKPFHGVSGILTSMILIAK